MGVGGGGVYGLVAAGILGGGTEKVKEDNNPKLVRKGELDPFAPKKEGEGEGAGEREHHRAVEPRQAQQAVQGFGGQ